MPQGEEGVEGVLAVLHVVAPATVEAAGVAPEAVDEVEARFLDRLERRVGAGKRVQRGGGGQQIRGPASPATRRNRRLAGGGPGAIRSRPGRPAATGVPARSTPRRSAASVPLERGADCRSRRRRTAVRRDSPAADPARRVPRRGPRVRPGPGSASASASLAAPMSAQHRATQAVCTKSRSSGTSWCSRYRRTSVTGRSRRSAISASRPKTV